jgi:hypothetical protein
VNTLIRITGVNILDTTSKAEESGSGALLNGSERYSAVDVLDSFQYLVLKSKVDTTNLQ